MKLSNGYKSIFKNASFLYASLLVNNITRFIYIIVLARYLGPELYGLFSYGQTWYNAFLPLSMLGLSGILIREVGLNKNSGAQIANVIASIRVISILLTAFICAITGWIMSDTSELSFLMLIFSLALLGRAVSLWGNQMFQAYESTYLTLNQEKLFRTGEVVIGIIIAITTNDVFLLAATHAFIWLTQGLRAVYLVQKNLQKITLTWHWQQIKTLLIKGFPLCLSLILDGLLIQGAVIFYKLNGASNDMIGNLAIIVQAFLVISGIFLAINQAVLPVISRAVDRKDSKDKIYIHVMIRIAFVFGTISGILGIAIGSDIVRLIFGLKYHLAMDHLGFMLWTLIPFIIQQAINSSLLAHGHFVKILQLNFIAFISMISCFFVLVENNNFTGVVLSILFGYSVLAITGIFTIYYLKLLGHITDILKLLFITVITLAIYSNIAEFNNIAALFLSFATLFSSLIFFNVVKTNELMRIIDFIKIQRN